MTTEIKKASASLEHDNATEVSGLSSTPCEHIYSRTPTSYSNVFAAECKLCGDVTVYEKDYS